LVCEARTRAAALGRPPVGEPGQPVEEGTSRRGRLLDRRRRDTDRGGRGRAGSVRRDVHMRLRGGRAAGRDAQPEDPPTLTTGTVWGATSSVRLPPGPR